MREKDFSRVFSAEIITLNVMEFLVSCFDRVFNVNVLKNIGSVLWLLYSAKIE
jgi:hypothetical protein